MNHKSFVFVLNHHHFLNALVISVLYIYISLLHSVTDLYPLSYLLCSGGNLFVFPVCHMQLAMS